jgi:hypothetical protein
MLLPLEGTGLILGTTYSMDLLLVWLSLSSSSWIYLKVLINFSLTYSLLTFVEANDLSSFSSSSFASYSIAMSPAIVTLLFRGKSGFIMIETDFRSIILRLEKLSFCSSSMSSLSLLSDSDSEEDELTRLHLILRFSTSTLMAAICRLSGEKLLRSFKSFRALFN